MKKESFLLIAPSIIMLLAVSIFPMAICLWLTFEKYNPLKPIAGSTFVGLDNLFGLLVNNRYGFWDRLSFTLGWVALVVSVEFILGLGAAILLSREFRGKGISRVLVLYPVMISPVVAGMVFRIIFNPALGPANQILGPILGYSVSWLGQPIPALIAITLTDIWQQTPFVTLVLMAGLEALPKDPFEAAEIDGASIWQTFRYVTLPLLTQAILFVFLLRTIFAFNTFDMIYMLTRGGPGEFTKTVSLAIWTTTWQQQAGGYGAAFSLIILQFIIFLSILFIRLLRKGRS